MKIKQYFLWNTNTMVYLVGGNNQERVQTICNQVTGTSEVQGHAEKWMPLGNWVSWCENIPLIDTVDLSFQGYFSDHCDTAASFVPPQLMFRTALCATGHWTRHWILSRLKLHLWFIAILYLKMMILSHFWCKSLKTHETFSEADIPS